MIFLLLLLGLIALAAWLYLMPFLLIYSRWGNFAAQNRLKLERIGTGAGLDVKMSGTYLGRELIFRYYHFRPSRHRWLGITTIHYQARQAPSGELWLSGMNGLLGETHNVTLANSQYAKWEIASNPPELANEWLESSVVQQAFLHGRWRLFRQRLGLFNSRLQWHHHFPLLFGLKKKLVFLSILADYAEVLTDKRSDSRRQQI